MVTLSSDYFKGLSDYGDYSGDTDAPAFSVPFSTYAANNVNVLVSRPNMSDWLETSLSQLTGPFFEEPRLVLQSSRSPHPCMMSPHPCVCRLSQVDIAVWSNSELVMERPSFSLGDFPDGPLYCMGL
jgi:hypothetical protein